LEEKESGGGLSGNWNQSVGNNHQGHGEEKKCSKGQVADHIFGFSLWIKNKLELSVL